MIALSVQLPPEVVLFYTRVAFTAGIPLEQVLRDALTNLAGKLSMDALQNNFENPL